MVKVFGLILLAATFTATWGQETKQVKRKDKDGNLEVYQVVKTDVTIRHGSYEKYFSDPTVRVKFLTEHGQYDHNMKTGAWTFYWGKGNIIATGSYERNQRNGSWEFYNNGVVIEKGNFKNDLREGPWTYFEKDKGILERGNYIDGKKVGKWTYHYYSIPVQTYDHSLDSVLQSYNDGIESEAIVDSSNKMVKVVLERAPQYVGHKRQMQIDMSTLTKYPTTEREISISGKVTVSFIVNEDGTTSNFEIIKDIVGGYGQAVIEAYKSNNVKWIPGIYNGKKIKAKYYQTVSFEMAINDTVGLGTRRIVYE